MESSVVDLYGLRCAVAVLVHARHNVHDLTTAHVVRLDSALRHLKRTRGEMGGTLRTSTLAVLSAEADPGGCRTLGAIDQLADLAHVNEDSAPALAASLSREVGQRTLFEIT